MIFFANASLMWRFGPVLFLQHILDPHYEGFPLTLAALPKA
jgi:hypothetical protein